MKYREQLDFHKRQDPRPYLAAMGLDTSSMKKTGTKVTGAVDAFGVSASFFLGRSGHYLFKEFSTGKRGSVVDIATEFASGDINRAREFLNAVITPPGIATPSKPTPNSNTTTTTTQSPALSCPPLQDSFPIEQIDNILSNSDKVDGDPGGYLAARGIRGIPSLHRNMLLYTRGRYQNLVLPYVDYGPEQVSEKLGVCGLEEKNESFKRYTTGGRAGIWLSGSGSEPFLFVSESPIDCLSYLQLKGWNEKVQLCAIRSGSESVINRYLEQNKDRLKGVFVGTDQDPAGAIYASHIFKACKKLDIGARYTTPPSFDEDWNDYLRAKQHANTRENPERSTVAA